MRARRAQRGGIMVQALVVLAGLVALMATLAANQHAVLQATQDRLRERRAEAAARSGIARALAVVQLADPNLVTLNDDWALLGDAGRTAYEMGDTAATTFRLEVIDAGSRLNVNDAPEAQLQLLPLLPEQVDGLLDWRDATGDTQPRANGAKDEYYNNLAQPYNTRMGRLTTLQELLLIRGWTARGLYRPLEEGVTATAAAVPLEREDGTPLPLADVLTADSGAPNTQADGSARINIGQGQVNEQTLVQLGIPANVAQLLAQGGAVATLEDALMIPGVTTDAALRMLDALTVTAAARVEGKLNVNTVSQAVLGTVPNLTPDIVSAIVAQQGNGFTSLGALASVPGLSVPLLAQIADRFTVGSDTWIVRAYGECSGVGAAFEAVIGVRNGRARVLTWDRLPDPGIPSWWGWLIEPEATADAGAVIGGQL